MGRRSLSIAISYIVLLIMMAFFLFPIIWMISLSFRTVEEYYVFPPVWMPRKITLENYYHSIFGGAPLLNYLRNSGIISVSSTILALLISIPAAYGIARFKVGGRNFATWILSNRMLPPIAIALPLFFLYNSWGLLDTHIALILPYTVLNIPFAIWLLAGFFEELPPDFEEAALIDGCSRTYALIKIVLPLAIPALAVTAIFCFIFSWNEFLLAVLLTRKDAATMPVMLAFYETLFLQTSWGYLSASSVVTLVPVFIASLLVHKYIVRGLTLGALRR